MVLGEFSEDTKEKLFSNKKVRSYLVEGIKRKTSLENDEVIINLALEFLLETLEESTKTELGQDRITAIKEMYLMANFDYMKANDII